MSWEYVETIIMHLEQYCNHFIRALFIVTTKPQPVNHTISYSGVTVFHAMIMLNHIWLFCRTLHEHMEFAHGITFISIEMSDYSDKFPAYFRLISLQLCVRYAKDRALMENIVHFVVLDCGCFLPKSQAINWNLLTQLQCLLVDIRYQNFEWTFCTVCMELRSTWKHIYDCEFDTFLPNALPLSPRPGSSTYIALVLYKYTKCCFASIPRHDRLHVWSVFCNEHMAYGGKTSNTNNYKWKITKLYDKTIDSDNNNNDAKMKNEEKLAQVWLATKMK